MTPKISVIIPVYNAEKYLDQCLQSVLNQSFTDFELLLINDGSKDRSGEICEAYAAKDSRIQVFHQKNKGVSAARNVGLDHAKGEWITFVDSDDWIGEGYFQIIENDINENIDWIFLSICKKTLKRKDIKTTFTNEILMRNEFLNKYTIHPHFFGPWAKFFKKNLIKKNHLKFDEKLSYGEDSLFNCVFMLYVNKISMNNSPYYIQRITENSLTTQPTNLINDQYKYEQLLNKLIKLSHSSTIIEKNIYPSASRYLSAIIQSENSVLFKYRKGKVVLNKHKNTFINDYKKSPGNGKLLAYLLKYNFYFIIITLLNHQNNAKT